MCVVRTPGKLAYGCSGRRHGGLSSRRTRHFQTSSRTSDVWFLFAKPSPAQTRQYLTRASPKISSSGSLVSRLADPAMMGPSRRRFRSRLPPCRELRSFPGWAGAAWANRKARMRSACTPYGLLGTEWAEGSIWTTSDLLVSSPTPAYPQVLTNLRK